MTALRARGTLVAQLHREEGPQEPLNASPNRQTQPSSFIARPACPSSAAQLPSLSTLGFC